MCSLWSGLSLISLFHLIPAINAWNDLLQMLLITPLLYLEIKQLTTFAQFSQAV